MQRSFGCALWMHLTRLAVIAFAEPCAVQAEPSMSVEEIQQRAAALRQQKAAGSAKEGLIEVSLSMNTGSGLRGPVVASGCLLAAAGGLMEHTDLLWQHSCAVMSRHPCCRASQRPPQALAAACC